MKRAIIMISLGLALAAGNAIVQPTRAACAYCVFSGQCLNSGICGRGCVCLKPAGEHWGSCFSLGEK